MMATASRHDSVPGMYRAKTMGYHIDNACLDGAHDATDFYIMARDVWNMKPFIPINSTNEGNVKNLPMSGVNEDGVPICQHKMYYDGYCKDRDRLKWKCPIKACKKNKSLACDYIDTCSSSDYGRVVYTHPKDNPYILLLPEEHRNGKIYMTTGRQQREYSSERRTTLTFVPLRLEVKNVFFSMLY